MLMTAAPHSSVSFNYANLINAVSKDIPLLLKIQSSKYYNDASNYNYIYYYSICITVVVH